MTGRLPPFLLPLVAGCPLPDKASDTADTGDTRDTAAAWDPPNVNTGYPNLPSEPSGAYDPRLVGCIVTSETEAGDYGHRYTFDDLGRRVEGRSWWPDGGDASTWQWDDANCIAVSTDGRDPTWSATCDPFGNPTHYDFAPGWGVTTTDVVYTYDDQDRPVTAVATGPDAPTYTSAYTWDGRWLTDLFTMSDDADDPVPGYRTYGTVRKDGRVEDWHFQVCGTRGADACADLIARVFAYDDEGLPLGFTEWEYAVTSTPGADPTGRLVDEREATFTAGADPRAPDRYDWVSGNPQGESLNVFTLACE